MSNLVNKLKTAGSLPDKKKTVLAEGELEPIRARLETSPRKSLKRVGRTMSVPKTWARRATKLLQLRSIRQRCIMHWRLKCIKRIPTIWRNQQTTSAAKQLQRVNNVLRRYTECIRSAGQHRQHPLQEWRVFIRLSNGYYISECFRLFLHDS